jgi:hypothetical protein
MFCGTLAAIPDANGHGVRPAPGMRLQMIDGARTLSHEYATTALRLVA